MAHNTHPTTKPLWSKGYDGVVLPRKSGFESWQGHQEIVGRP